MKIVVAGIGYVGLSLAVLLSQQNEVIAVDIDDCKVEKLNNWISPIQDEYIEKFLLEHEERNLNIRATLDAETAYSKADFIIIAAPTNYDSKKNFFDTSAVEAVIRLVIDTNSHREQQPAIVIKSTIPVGFTERIKKLFGINNIMFFPEFLRESKALYDNLYPSRIIAGCDEYTQSSAEVFTELLTIAAEKENIPVLFMRPTEAESVKLFSNTYLALFFPIFFAYIQYYLNVQMN